MELKEIPYQLTWEIRHQVMWPNKSLDYVKLPLDDRGLHYELELNGRWVSIISLFINDREVQFRKFATLKDQQGKGYGTKLFFYMIEELKKRGLNKVWCNARMDKASFYKKFGMMETDKHFSKGGKDYIIMEMHLRQ